PLIIKPNIEMSYQHITSNQRNELSALLIANIKKKDIAKQLGKDRTTIWRELKRNGLQKIDVRFRVWTKDPYGFNLPCENSEQEQELFKEVLPHIIKPPKVS
ncbi:helix-turn-helix domain-containing protein, partial [Patescibacteria group bacterium]|nr:helix-turn-helix domain-containing protein [Patescibacteria group bacterium]